MYMKSSTELPNSYNEIARQARETAESIYITMNGNGDTVIMGDRKSTRLNSSHIH